MNAQKKKSDALAWTLVLGSAALCFVAYILLSRAAVSYFGPQTVAVSPTSVWTFSQATLWRLTHGGKVSAHFSSASLEIGPSVDVMVALADNAVALHDFRAKQWRHCRVGNDVRCEPLLTAEAAGHNGSDAAIAVAPEGDRWAFADFARGEILVLDASRRVIARGKGLASNESGIAAWLPDGALALMASDSPTLYVTRVVDGALTPLEKRWTLQADGKTGGYVWAAAYSAEHHRWLMAHGSVRRATHYLWAVDENGARRALVPLDDGGEPAYVALLDQDTALVPDAVRGRIHRVELRGLSVSPFGDDAFQAALASGQTRYDLIDRASLGAIGGMLVFPLVIGLFFVERDQKRANEALGPLPAARPIRGETWINPNAAWRKMQRRLTWFSIVLVNALTAAQVLVFRDAIGSQPRFIYAMAGTFVAMVALAVFTLHAQRKTAKRRLGVREGFVLYDNGTGRIEPYPMRDVLTDGQRLLVGRHPFVFGVQGLPSPWNSDEIRSEILARLPKKSWVSRYKLERAMYGRNPALIGLILLVIAVMLLMPRFIN